MRKDFYKDLIDGLIPSALQGTNYQFNQDHLYDSSMQKGVNSFCISLKNYNMKGGMSDYMFRPENKDANYTVKGPMGKGLGLNQDS